MDTEQRVNIRLDEIKKDAVKGGYILNTDDEVVLSLVEGLVTNNDRYGIESCPCRLYKGTNDENMDIVCPCVYRDDDLAEYGACYCALYIASEKDAETQKQVPERRPKIEERKKGGDKTRSFDKATLAYPVYRCSVCGYLCANNNPPREIGRAHV